MRRDERASPSPTGACSPSRCPIVLSNATIPLLGAADTAIIGQLGQAAPIGAVGLGAIILASIYWIFGFLRMGTTGLVAQARGAGEAAETGALLMRGLIDRRRRRPRPRRRPGRDPLGRLPARPRLARGRGPGPHLPRHPHLGSAGRHLGLCPDRLAHRHGAHPRHPRPAGRDERDQRRPLAPPRLRLPPGRARRRHRDPRGRVDRPRDRPLALPRRLRRGAVARLGPRLRPRPPPPHGAGQRRHPGPLGDPAGELHQLPLLRRRARRRHPRRQPGPAAVPLLHQLRARRLRLRRRGAGRPDPRRGRAARAAPRGRSSPPPGAPASRS